MESSHDKPYNRQLKIKTKSEKDGDFAEVFFT